MLEIKESRLGSNEESGVWSTENKQKNLGGRRASRINNITKNLDMRERKWKLMENLIAETGWQGRGRRHLIYYLIKHPGKEGKS